MPRPPATVALGIALLAAGEAFAVQPLVVAGVAVTALATCLWAWCAVAARGVSLSRELERRRVEEEEPMTLRLVATGRVALPGGAIAEPLLAQAAPLPCGRRRTAVRVDVRFARRGRRRLEPAGLILRDPLGIARRRAATTAAQDVLVLPRVEPVRRVDVPGDGGAARAAAAVPGLPALEPDGLRPYRRGAPASRIHWPALARGAGLLERRLSPDADGLPLIVLDAGGPVPAEHLDAAVRAAASLCLGLARAGGCRLLLPGERRPRRVGPDLGGWPAAWASLALVRAGAEPVHAALAARAGPLIHVAARLPARPGGRTRGVSAALVVVPIAAGDPAGARSVIEVAGCRGHLVGPRARRAAA